MWFDGNAIKDGQQQVQHIALTEMKLSVIVLISMVHQLIPLEKISFGRSYEESKRSANEVQQ